MKSSVFKATNGDTEADLDRRMKIACGKVREARMALDVLEPAYKSAKEDLENAVNERMNISSRLNTWYDQWTAHNRAKCKKKETRATDKPDPREVWARKKGYMGPFILKGGGISQRYFTWRARNGYSNCPDSRWSRMQK